MTDARFFVRNDGEGLVRYRDSEFAYLRARGWVKVRRRRRHWMNLKNSVDQTEVDGWRECTREQARNHALRFFSENDLEAAVLGLRQMLMAYLEAQGLREPRLSRLSVPHGPSPWRIGRDLQVTAQEQQVKAVGLPSDLDENALDGWIAQAREGYEQERSRIAGIQQRASFFLGATGLTTTAVLANGSLLYGNDALASNGMRISVGVLLTLTTVALVTAGYAALAATMITFELAQPDSAWQIERRIKLDHRNASRYLLATILLATQRTEVIGDWKIRRLKRARLAFALAILFAVLASVALLLTALF